MTDREDNGFRQGVNGDDSGASIVQGEGEKKMSVEQIIKKNVSELGSTVYITPSIQEKKINNAVASIALGVDPSVIVAIVDTTITHNAKEGFVFTGDAVYIKEGPFSKPVQIMYADILNAQCFVETNVKKNGTHEENETIIIFGKDGEKIREFKYSWVKEAFADLINLIVSAGGEDAEFTTSQQSLQLKDMDMQIRMAYIKIVCNYLHHETEGVNNREYTEIISLLVLNDIDNENRFSLRRYIMEKNELEDIKSLLGFIDENAEEGSKAGVHLSLMQDIVKIFRIRESSRAECNYSSWVNDGFIVSLQSELNIANKQIEFFFEKLQADEDIISKRQNNTEIKKTLADLGAKAALIGVPAAALYLSGSIWIFKGGILLMKGAMGVLGPLAIGVVAGYAAYRGIKYMTGISDIENNSKREMMLQGIIRNLQKSLDFLVEDVNYMAQKLAGELENSQITGIMIEKLKSQLLMLSKGATTVSKQVTHAGKEAVIAKLPQKLNKTRLKELASNPTQKKYLPVVLDGYPETNSTTPDGETKTELCLNCALSLGELEEIYGILDDIGYFSIKDAGLASAKGFVKNLLKQEDNKT